MFAALLVPKAKVIWQISAFCLLRGSMHFKRYLCVTKEKITPEIFLLGWALVYFMFQNLKKVGIKLKHTDHHVSYNIIVEYTSAFVFLSTDFIGSLPLCMNFSTSVGTAVKRSLSNILSPLNY